MTPDLEKQRPLARIACGQWVRNMRAAGYDDAAIANALLSQFQALTLLHVDSVMGWIGTLATLVLDAAGTLALERDHEDEVARLMQTEGLSFHEAVERVAGDL